MALADAITAIVPVWNRLDLVEPVIRTLRAQTAAPAEVIVVDNGSTDGAAEVAAGAGARVIRMGRNAGFAMAVNRGIRESGTAWVAVVNNDVELAPDYLELLRRRALEVPAWFATGKVFRQTAPALLDGTFDVLTRGGCAWRAGHGEPDGPAFSRARAIYSAPWTAALFRRALFDCTGLLEESFESYLEDVEFGVRCARGGYAGVYVPEALAWHAGSATLGAWNPETVRRIARNQLLLAARHLPASCIWPVLVAQGLWGQVARRHGCGRAWLAGIVQGLRAWRRTRRIYDPESSKILMDWLRENDRLVRDAPGRFWKVYSRLTTGGAG